MNLYVAFIFTLSMVSCLSPEQIKTNQSKDMIALDELLLKQTPTQATFITKVVTINKKTESSQFPFDTMIIKQDLKWLVEHSFGDLVGASNYTRENVANTAHIVYKKKEIEHHGPQKIELKYNNSDEIVWVSVTKKEKNMLYDSFQETIVWYNLGSLVSYSIKGFQKILGMDTTTFHIQVSIFKNE